jgi:peroxiredoxin
MVVISPQQSAYNRQMREEKKLTFAFLSDRRNQTASRYGIVFTMPEDLRAVYLQFGLNVPEYTGDDSWTLPLPTRLIIDRQGVIRYAQINADYTRRPEPEHTVEALKTIV